MEKLGLVTENEDYFWLNKQDNMWNIIDVVDEQSLTYDQAIYFIAKLMEYEAEPPDGDAVEEALYYALSAG